MNTNDIAIATITWARDKQEEELLEQSLRHLAELKLPVFICDGGSSENFINFLKSIPHFSLVSPASKGVWSQAKASLFAAFDAGSKFIFYTEPDKQHFFEKGMATMLAQVNVDEQTGVIKASRTVNAFATFPRFQQMTETTINNCISEIIGTNADYTYGPFILNSKLLPYLAALKDDIGWGWRPYATCICKALGLRVENVAGEFYCPPNQRQDTAEERIYRIKQLNQNIQGIVEATMAQLEAADESFG